MSPCQLNCSGSPVTFVAHSCSFRRTQPPPSFWQQIPSWEVRWVLLSTLLWSLSTNWHNFWRVGITNIKNTSKNLKRILDSYPTSLNFWSFDARLTMIKDCTISQSLRISDSSSSSQSLSSYPQVRLKSAFSTSAMTETSSSSKHARDSINLAFVFSRISSNTSMSLFSALCSTTTTVLASGLWAVTKNSNFMSKEMIGEGILSSLYLVVWSMIPGRVSFSRAKSIALEHWRYILLRQRWASKMAAIKKYKKQLW